VTPFTLQKWVRMARFRPRIQNVWLCTVQRRLCSCLARQLLYTFYKDLRAKQNAERLHGIADSPKHRGPGLASLREPQSEDKLSFTGVVSVHTDEQSTTV
jgi:hypothetical protein